MNTRSRSLLLASLCAALLAAGGCSDTATVDGQAAELGVHLSYVESAACAPPEAGTLPPGITLIELSLRRAGDGAELQQEGLLVDATARCRDDQQREFACPFDVDGDGLRERFFALDALSCDAALVLHVTLKDAVSTVRWQGSSAPVRCDVEQPTVVSVPLRSTDPACQP